VNSPAGRETLLSVLQEAGCILMSGGRVLVHCMQGLHRAGGACVCLLVLDNIRVSCHGDLMFTHSASPLNRRCAVVMYIHASMAYTCAT
jgi:hypothetical protein